MAMRETKPVGIVGMGMTGQSVARFLQQQGIDCIGFDESPVAVDGLKLIIGSFHKADFGRCSRLIVSPGIDWHHPALQHVRQTGMPVHGDLDLFCRHFQGDVIAVTGTNGKTTTVTLIQTLLDTLPGGIEAGGNIGRPMLDLLDETHPARRVVLELSSFQLERSSRLRPDWAVLLNLQSDHADMHADMATYEAAKRKLFEHQQAGDSALLPLEKIWDELQQQLQQRGVKVRRFGIVQHLAEDVCAGVCHEEAGQWHVFWQQDGQHQQVANAEIPLRGMHQHINLAVAAQAAADYGVSAAVIREALQTFRGLDHRLQWIGHYRGRDWYDDSKATNPDAAMAALNSFDKVLWICGGLHKDVDLAPMAKAIARHVRHAYVIGEDPRPYLELVKSVGVPVIHAGTMEKAVHLAARFAHPLPVLLSPAAASQDQFRHYAERGQVFAAAVRALEKVA